MDASSLANAFTTAMFVCMRNSFTPHAIDKKSDFFSLGQTFLIEPLPPLGQPEFLNALPDRQAACVLFGIQT